MDSLSGQRVAIYARHSTHMQTGSAEDQVARCVHLVEQQGGVVAGVYSDAAKTGATKAHRKELNRLVSDARSERYDAVLFEDLSRLSRDIADTATIFRTLTFAGIALHSVTEGRITELHIALKGAMNALYLKDVADKSRRGLIAAVKRGRILTYCYGYEPSPTLTATGEQVPGPARINPEEAAVVRRIYMEVAGGKPVAEIVRGLNLDDIPSPSGHKWSKAALYGARYRRDGLLRRPIYAGNYVWGRTSYTTDPGTGKKVRGTRPREEWTTLEVPDLAIVDKETWEAVQERLDRTAHRLPKPATKRPPPASRPTAVPVHVTTGISRCTSCGTRLTTTRGGWLRCGRYFNQVDCDQAFQIPRATVVRKVLRILRMRLANRHRPLRRIIEEEHRKRLTATSASTPRRHEIETAVARRRKQISALLDLVEDGTGGAETRARIRDHEKCLRADVRTLNELADIASRSGDQDTPAVEERARGAPSGRHRPPPRRRRR